ncbi:sperm equatorial segment protein 1 [Trichosurus vulpecula]|uniref:sperm equatorial segment protein 1 n=1 Tax=Trichosurus vulpecula TaxID=9337 RepID=UPI00186AD8A3|nr:sperm equatorial segment protein 1 [Trichosurus vulpecula]
MGAKAAVLLAIMWLRPLSIMAYPWLLTLNDTQMSSSNLSKEDSTLKHYAEILQQMAQRVPTQGTAGKEQATTVSSNRENEIKEATAAVPKEILEKIPVFLTSRSSKCNKTVPKVPLMKEPAWPKEKLELKSSIRHPREQNEKDNETTVNMATEEAPGNMENVNLEDDDNSVLETDESDSEEEALEKAVISTLELAAKLAVEQELSKEMLDNMILKPLVKVAPKPVPKAPAKVYKKASLESALKLIEEASQQVKKNPEKRVILGQMALVAPPAMDYPETQVHDLGAGFSQPSVEAKDQLNKKRVVEDQILKKIADINTEIKRALKNAKHHMEFKDDVESAKKYLIQSLSLVEEQNTSGSGHKPQKLTREKDDDERIRLFINFLYDFKSQLTEFLNINNIPFDLQGKATTVFSIMEAVLCGNQQKRENIIKELLEDNMRMLNMLNVTINP